MSDAGSGTGAERAELGYAYCTKDAPARPTSTDDPDERDRRVLSVLAPDRLNIPEGHTRYPRHDADERDVVDDGQQPDPAVGDDAAGVTDGPGGIDRDRCGGHHRADRIRVGGLG